MKNKFLLIALLINKLSIAQCPFAVTLSSKGNLCVGANTLVVNSTNKLANIKWFKDGVLVTTVFASESDYTKNGITVAGGNGYGPADNQIQPTSIIVDKYGTLFVGNRGYSDNGRIVKFPSNSTGATKGFIIAGGNGYGTNANQLKYISSIFFDGVGNLYAADIANHRIQKFPAGSTSSSQGITIAGGNGTGSASNQLISPSGIFVDAQGSLYVTDEGNSRIQKFLAGSSTGITVAGGNGFGSDANQFVGPRWIIVDTIGNIYVTDCGNQRIQKFPPNSTSSTNGITIAGGNGNGTAGNQLFYPNGIFIDKKENLYVADYYNDRIQKFPPGSTSSTIGTTIAGGLSGSAANELDHPLSLFVDDSENVFVADYMNNRIQKFSKNNIDSTFIPTTPGKYTAVVTDKSGCTVETNFINIIAKVKLGIFISANKPSECAGNTTIFTAISSNTGTSPIYTWHLNDNIVGANSNVYNNAALINGDVVNCIISDANGCIEADTSNKIIANIKALPVVGHANDETVSLGQNIILNIPVTGNISYYLWSPAEELSSNNILHPISTPKKTTIYSLKVISIDGCVADGSITVKVNSPIRIPNCFTPNSDGLNDIFYLMGGTDKDVIRDFSVYNKWGKRLFITQNVTTNDRRFGWNGTYDGELQSQGVYVYVATVVFANGTKHLYKGTIMLIM